MAEIDPAYLAHLTAFQRALKQKTGLLRDLQAGPASSRAQPAANWRPGTARSPHHAAPVCLRPGAIRARC